MKHNQWMTREIAIFVNVLIELPAGVCSLSTAKFGVVSIVRMEHKKRIEIEAWAACSPRLCYTINDYLSFCGFCNKNEK